MTPAEEPEIGPDDVIAVFKDLADGIKRIVPDEDTKRELLQLIVTLGARFAGIEEADGDGPHPPAPYPQVWGKGSLESEWREWVRRFAPRATGVAACHERIWEWFEGLRPGVKPAALVECVFRGGSKSTTVDLALARIAVRG